MKYRHELKYICSEMELTIIENRIKAFCVRDSHAGEDGMYHIRSAYFDDERNTCFYENENGTDPREKYRIRMYNCDTSFLSLECKSKRNSMTNKKASEISIEQWENLIECQKPYHMDSDLLRKLCEQQQSRGMRPVVLVEYDRIPYVYAAGNVRITIDRDVRSTTHVENFLKESIPMRPVMPIGQHVLEVKYDEFLPDYLYETMNLGMLRQTAFSKYYMCRKYTI